MKIEDLEQYDYKTLLEMALSQVPDDIDTREGSIIYDALSPACYLLAEFYMQLRAILIDVYATTANNEWLDLRVAEQGISRYPSTSAIRKAYFTNISGQSANINLGTRFSTIEENPINYYVSKDLGGGYYELTCEEKGTIGNNYIGELLPLDYGINLETATITEIIIPGQDTETDDALRNRYFVRINEKAFGGNIAQYKQEINDIDGVGAVQVYPVWNGGGTVKCSVIDASYNRITDEFIQKLQETIDPVNNSGEGLGIAPIGHKVTITTPVDKVVNITTNVQGSAGVSILTIKEEIKKALEEYLLSLRQIWGNSNEINVYNLSVYIARINATILNIPGVVNVTNTLINGMAEDLVLIQNATTQELPKLGTVIING